MMSDDPQWPWSILGQDGMPDTAKDWARAYDIALKRVVKARDIDGFNALRSAYWAGAEILEWAAQSSDLPAAASIRTHKTRAEQVEALFARLEIDAETGDPAAWLPDTLTDPLIHDPQIQDEIRIRIARLLRAGYVAPGLARGYVSVFIGASVLLTLDDTYGWMTEYAAFERDFGDDFTLYCTLLRAAITVFPLQYPTPHPLAIAARAASVQNLARFISNETIRMPPHIRILEALRSPLLADGEEAVAPLRAAIAGVVLRNYKQGPEWYLLAAEISQDLLQKLDAAFGWLHDDSAFQRDLGDNREMQIALAWRAYYGDKRPVSRDDGK